MSAQRPRPESRNAPSIESEACRVRPPFRRVQTPPGEYRPDEAPFSSLGLPVLPSPSGPRQAAQVHGSGLGHRNHGCRRILSPGPAAVRAASIFAQPAPVPRPRVDREPSGKVRVGSLVAERPRGKRARRRRPGHLGGRRFRTGVREDCLDSRGVLDAGDDVHRPAEPRSPARGEPCSVRANRGSA